MRRHVTSVCILCAGLSLAATAGSAQTRLVTGSPAIADTVAQLFAGIAEATNALDVAGLLAQYEDSEALTYVAVGRVTRSKSAFRDILTSQLGGLESADLRMLDTYVDVLSDDVAVVTATYEFTATVPERGDVRTTGTYMCIYVRRDGRWQVRYSAHSFPQ